MWKTIKTPNIHALFTFYTFHHQIGDPVRACSSWSGFRRFSNVNCGWRGNGGVRKVGCLLCIAPNVAVQCFPESGSISYRYHDFSYSYRAGQNLYVAVSPSLCIINPEGLDQESSFRWFAFRGSRLYCLSTFPFALP